jgi:hypothetical protein
MRSLIEAALTDDELKMLYREQHQEARDSSPPEQPKAVLVRQLVGEANRRHQLAQVLTWVQQLNPGLYFQSESRLRDAMLRRADEEWEQERKHYMRQGKGLKGFSSGVVGCGFVVGIAALICGLFLVAALVDFVQKQVLAGVGGASVAAVLQGLLAGIVLALGLSVLGSASKVWRRSRLYEMARKLYGLRRERILALGSGTPVFDALVRDALADLTDDVLSGLNEEGFQVQRGAEKRDRIHMLVQGALDPGEMEVDRLLAAAIRAVGRSTVGR